MSRYATYEPPEEATAYLRQASPTRSFIPVLLSLAALYLGPNVLMALGYPILDPGSGPLFRIHPLTYLLLALFFVQLLLRNFRLGILLSNRSVKWYFLISLLVFGYSLMGSSASNGYFLDTFVNAFILVYLFGYYPDQARKACWFALQ
ncbi:MAG TPA: hypothetical protein VHK69_21935, partial [Chitinophagaceae bacterium]|nr:hypothetical protein [Chitinophagaceae bacterium]